MPVNTHFSVKENIYCSGDINFGVWINDYVA